MAAQEARINITAKDQTKAAFSSVRKTMGSVTSAVFSFQSAIVSAAGIGGMGLLVKSSLAAADALAKTSDRLGVTTESLGAMQHAANLAGVSNENLDKSLEKMNINLAKAALETGTAQESLDALGLSAKELAMMPTDQALGAIADAMQDVESSTLKMKIATDIFGKSGGEMINMLDGGSEALEAAAEEADALGLSLSRVDAAKIEAANDAMHKVQQAIKGIGLTITSNLAPYIEAVADLFVDAAKAGGGWEEQITGAIKAVIRGVASLFDIIQGLQFAWYGVSTAFNKVAELLIIGIGQVARPIIKLLSLIPGLGVSYEDTMSKITAASDFMAERTAESFQKLEDVAFSGRASEKVEAMFLEVEEAATANAEKVAMRVAESQAQEQGQLWDHLQTTVNMHEKASKQIQKVKKAELTALEKFTAMSWKGQVQSVAGSVEEMTRGVANSSKTMFNINKAAGISNAIINTAVGVSQALAAYPPPISFAMAALQLAAGVAQVAAIRSTSFGGGGSAPSMAGSSGGGVPVQTPETTAGTGGIGDVAPGETGTGQEITVNLYGSGYSKDDVRNLIDSINEELDDGSIMRVN